MKHGTNIFTSIDLEMNADGKNTYEIIQLGAVIGDVHTGEIFEKLSLYVNIEKPLYPFITELTGITDYTIISKGTTLLEAYNILKDAHIKYNSHSMIVQWGGGDEYMLKKQLFEKGMLPGDWIFGRTFWNVKTLCQAIQLSKGCNIQGGLKKNCNKFGVKFEGPAHDALKDSYNTFRLFQTLLPKLKNI
jgi:inhibitor of KinA sporulation pathway (predicted exonuclease)